MFVRSCLVPEVEAVEGSDDEGEAIEKAMRGHLDGRRRNELCSCRG
jgi:hypothetical protein